MAEDKWNIQTASECIKRTGGSVSRSRIVHSHPGLKVLGAIDYLVNTHKYTFSAEKQKEVKEEEDTVTPKKEVVVIKKKRNKEVIDNG